MGSLREIKDRIASVRSTLKITSSMKLVASAKLHKSQNALAGMVAYEKTFRDIISCVPGSVTCGGGGARQDARVAIVAFASNSSLCGGFNSAIARQLSVQMDKYPGAETILLGRKLPGGRFSELMAHPSYESAAALADSLVEKFRSGEYSRIVLVYSHYASTSSQIPTVEQFLPLEAEQGKSAESDRFIFEPDPQKLLDSVMDQMLRLKIYTVVLDTATAEHAARTVAMQTASDNAEGLLSELTLEYNKGRQQKITAEILDLIGGAQ